MMLCLNCKYSILGNSKTYYNDLIVREMPHNVRDLHIAVKSNNSQSVRSLIAQGVNINFPFMNSSSSSFRDGNTPLLNAVSLNYIEIVQLLVEAGAYINKCDRNGCTPLYKAAFHGRPMLIELLSRAGADVNLSDYEGKTPLYICVNNAIVHMHRQAIHKLLAAGAIVDKCDADGRAPIHVAAHWKLVDVLALLVSLCSDVNICDSAGHTPLFVCVSSLSTRLYLEDLRLQLPCIVVLFRAGADMFNIVEWIIHKGPGIPYDMLSLYPDFMDWYMQQLRQPATLTNMCRKCIQMRIATCSNSSPKETATLIRSLPLPSDIRRKLARRMFYRTADCVLRTNNEERICNR